MLLDKFGRIHDYLRISLTDKCNFRCFYCMPSECNSFLSNEHLMTSEEIVGIASEFIQLGIKKIRLTGGEPLVRKDFATIVDQLSALNVELLLTTNGVLLHKHINNLKNAGINAVNVSLDTLQPNTFHHITKRDRFEIVWNNIMLLLKNDFRVKINVVAISGLIENNLSDFINITKHMPLHVRFIEYMPFNGNEWDNTKVISAEQMLDTVARNYDVIKLMDEPHATARKYKVIGHEGTFAFITTMSNQFCGDCNRIRLTADGKMKNCLFSAEESDLLSAFRRGEDIVPLIKHSLITKKGKMGGQFERGYKNTNSDLVVNRSMVRIGG